MRGTVLAVSLAAVRDDLAAALEETLKLARRLAEDARDSDVPVAELVAQATMLGRLDQRREELIGELRRTASAGLRATRPGPPIREVVLDALDELGWPQNARFLEEYLWAKRQLQLDSRAFASLRRDELRAWQRSPGARSRLHRARAEPRRHGQSALAHQLGLGAAAAGDRLSGHRAALRPAEDPGAARPRLPRPARHAARAVRDADPRHRAAAGVRVRRRDARVARARQVARDGADRGDPRRDDETATGSPPLADLPAAAWSAAETCTGRGHR